MSKPAVMEDLQDKVMEMEAQLTAAEKLHGRDSELYKAFLKEFACAWFTLRMSRDKGEFLHEIL